MAQFARLALCLQNNPVVDLSGNAPDRSTCEAELQPSGQARGGPVRNRTPFRDVGIRVATFALTQSGRGGVESQPGVTDLFRICFPFSSSILSLPISHRHLAFFARGRPALHVPR